MAQAITTAMLSLAAAALCWIAPVPVPQGDAVVARFRFPDGKAGAVTRSQLAREVGERHRRGEHGQEALQVLVDRELVAVEARDAGIEPSQADVAACIDGIEAQLNATGATLAEFLVAKRMDRAQFEQKFIRFQVAHQRLVMKALDLRDPAEVTPELQRLWLEEARGRHKVVVDEAELSPAIVAQVDARRFDLADLGAELLPNVPLEERNKMVRRIVLRELLQRRAEQAGIRVTEEDTRAEIAERRKKIESDPRYGGIRYDDWLRSTQGMTVDELARSAQLVATVQLERLAAITHPPEELARRLREDRTAVLRAHGEKRAVSIVLIRGVDEPNAIVKRTFDAAREEALRVRGLLDEGQSFLRIAQIHSEDPYSKVRGGDLGLFARGSDEIPDAVLDAAFSLPVLQVSEPVRVPLGYCLVRVAKVVPAPDDDALLDAMREDMAQRDLAGMLDAASIEVIG
jgi:parvulin-like peptidyl-prolyl isomerase